jgi:hypothetical protein
MIAKSNPAFASSCITDGCRSSATIVPTAR